MRDAARDLLASVYNWFTEGFETLDLKEAKALLDALASWARWYSQGGTLRALRRKAEPQAHNVGGALGARRETASGRNRSSAVAAPPEGNKTRAVKSLHRASRLRLFSRPARSAGSIVLDFVPCNLNLKP